ncbi:MAG: PEP-CTERM sorting domain-containing protein [Planctomycetota bacterium]
MWKILAIAAVAAGTAQSQVLWDEVVDGDLGDMTSNDDAPTFLGNLGVGANIVRGTTAPIAMGDLADAFSFTVPVGLSLQSVVLTAYSTADGGPGTSGIVFYDSLGGSSGLFLGGASYGAADVGTDTLFVSTGLTDFGPGDLAISVREFGGPDATWELTLNVVPAPASAALLGLGGLAAARRRR